MSLKKICQKNLKNLRNVIRHYVYHNPNCIKNDIAYELGLYSGYGNGRTNYLSWSLIMRDKYIITTNTSSMSLKKSYLPQDIENPHEKAQYYLQQILTCIIELLQKKPLGNTKIAKKLGIETYEKISDNGKKNNQNWFSWSCLSILYKMKIIDLFDKNNQKINPYCKQKNQRIAFYAVRLENPLDNLIYQDSINPKKPDSYGIQLIIKYLTKLKILYEKEYKFPNCIDKRNLPFDIYLTKYKAIIEFDGAQHFYPVFSAESHHTTVKHDKMKNDYCLANKIPLLRISYEEIDNIQQHISEFINMLADKKKRPGIILKDRAYGERE